MITGSGTEVSHSSDNKVFYHLGYSIPVKVNLYFGVSQTRNQHERGSKQIFRVEE
jgi:hypothetical protein